MASSEAGFSLIELLIVLIILTIITAFSLSSLTAHRSLYSTEDQSLRLVDMIRQANQLALSRQRIVRLEIDATDKVIRVIDENNAPTNPALWQQAAISLLASEADVRMLNNTLVPAPGAQVSQPEGVPSGPVSNHPFAVFRTEGNGHLMWIARFCSDGSVVDESNAPLSATFMLWQPDPNKTPNDPKFMGTVRAVTILGGSGIIRYWEYNGTTYTRG